MSDLVNMEDDHLYMEAYEMGYVDGKADRPQGEWEPCGYEPRRKKCSLCGWVHNPFLYGNQYCPNCGAAMRGADDEY